MQIVMKYQTLISDKKMRKYHQTRDNLHEMSNPIFW